ncbi:hypothetical protein Droror1_Dr00028201, partial [Drosera rotundifolia]
MGGDREGGGGDVLEACVEFFGGNQLQLINYVPRILHSLPPASPPVTTSSCSASSVPPSPESSLSMMKPKIANRRLFML